MPKLHIKSHRTGNIIFAGNFDSAKSMVEQAVREGVPLDEADLRHANLQNAALDDMVMRHGRLDFTNLTGANLSETDLDGTSFAYATLHGACLCESSLRNCNFDAAQFGSTDIAGSRIGKGRFSGLSALTLNFIDAESLENCLFKTPSGTICPFTKPPLVIGGLPYPVALFDRHLLIGAGVLSMHARQSETNDNIPGDMALGGDSCRLVQSCLESLASLRRDEARPEAPEAMPAAI